MTWVLSFPGQARNWRSSSVKPQAAQGQTNKGGQVMSLRRGGFTLKQAEQLYLLVERPETNPVTNEPMTEDEWNCLTEDVRKWIAFYCGFNYLNRRELKKVMEKEKKQAMPSK
jgi:hypothetical protein